MVPMMLLDERLRVADRGRDDGQLHRLALREQGHVAFRALPADPPVEELVTGFPLARFPIRNYWFLPWVFSFLKFFR